MNFVINSDALVKVMIKLKTLGICTSLDTPFIKLYFFNSAITLRLMFAIPLQAVISAPDKMDDLHFMSFSTVFQSYRTM